MLPPSSPEEGVNLNSTPSTVSVTFVGTDTIARDWVQVQYQIRRS
jgi:hypothetical protein